MSARVLIVDDEPSVRKVLAAILGQEGYATECASSTVSAEHVLETVRIDVVITDVRMPGRDGLSLLDHLLQNYADIPAIVLTGHASVSLAVDAMRRGAVDFLEKPCERDTLVASIDRALTRRGSEPEKPPPTKRIETAKLVGHSAAMADLLKQVDRVAPAPQTVLVAGETGTGKEEVARAIHDRSGRNGPLVIVHCAALPENLFESELFGYEKGAFTGAHQRKPGRVELAEGGTLFLDEIGEVPLQLQPKLLRLLQQREFEPLGGTKTMRCNVRFAAATHRDLKAMVRAGTYREDLYFRLDVIRLTVPPLRDRREDIPLLFNHFLHRLAAESGSSPRVLTDEARGRMVEHSFPGNVRELLHLAERLHVLYDDPVTKAQLEEELRIESHIESAEGHAPDVVTSGSDLASSRQHAERMSLQEALARTHGNRSQAARVLGISRRTLYNKLDELGLSGK